MKMKIYSLLVMLLVTPCVFTYSQASALDSTFNDDGIVINQNGLWQIPYSNSIAIHGGSVYSAGAVVTEIDSSYVVSNFDFLICRNNLTNGDVDTTFGIDGFVTTSFGTNYDAVNDLLVQADGKLIAIGKTGLTVIGGSSYVGGENIAIARYNSNGSLDSSFGIGGKVITSVVDTSLITDNGVSGALQMDGKIVVLGNYINGWDTLAGWLLVRYNSNGTLDSTLDGDGKKLIFLDQHQGGPQKVLVQNDGKILVVGYEEELNGNMQAVIVRLNQDGSLDSSFSDDGISVISFGNNYESISSACLQLDDKIVLVGTTTDYWTSDIFVVRLNPDGSFDNSFDLDGKLIINMFPVEYSHEVAIADTNKIVILGGFKDYFSSPQKDMLLVKLNLDGSFFNLFDSDGIATNDIDANYDMAIQDDGKVITTGYLDGDFTVLMRFHNNLFPLNPATNLNNLDAEVEDAVLYPNPVYDSFSILDMSGDLERVQLIDANGRLIRSYTPSQYYSVMELKSGVYFIRLVKNNSTLVYKLIKQ